MPSGRCFPFAFAMYTRLTGWAATGLVRRRTRSANAALPGAVTTTLPSTPAVLRPAFTSVSRRTLASALARERSISFCKLRTFFRSPACDAVKNALPYTPYFVFDFGPVDRPPVQVSPATEMGGSADGWDRDAALASASRHSAGEVASGYDALVGVLLASSTSA
jgi:hypothetical protein